MKTPNQFIFLSILASALAAQAAMGSAVVSLEVVTADAAETLPFQNAIFWAEFRVLRTGPTNEELVVFLNTQQGSAKLGEDYWLDGVKDGSIVRIPAGSNSLNVRLYPIDDSFYEGDESVSFHLIAPPPGSNPYEIDFAHSSIEMIIHDNDPVLMWLAIDAPRNGQHFETGAAIELRAQIFGLGNGTNELWTVEFFDGGQRIGATRLGAPIWWSDASGGLHVITARATNSQGMVLISAAATIQVGPGAALPVVKIGATSWRTGEPCPTCLVAPGILTIERTAPTNVALTVFLEIGGTAAAGEDYQALPASVEIPAGQSSVQLKLLARDDQLAEGPEIVRVRVLPQPPPLLPPTYFVNVYAKEALLVIFDDEPNAPQARLDIVAPADGSHLRFPSTVELSALAVNTQNEVYGPVEFYDGDQLVARSAGTATTQPAIPGLPSVHTAYWTNPPVGQHILTARTRLSIDQSITSPPVNVTVDSPTFPVVRLETFPLQNPQAPEFCPFNADCAYPSFVVHRSGPTDADLRVYLSYSGTATAGVDYPSLPDSLVIPAGRETAFLMLVPKDDKDVEGPETVVARFTPVPGPGYIPHPDHLSATITIIDDERPFDTVVSIGVDDPIASEFSILAVVDPARFRISRTGDLSRDLLVFFSLHGSATPGQDYQELNSSIQIPAGQSSVTFDVTPKFDQLAEGMETVLVRLEPSLLANPLPTYEIARSSREAVAIILDNASEPTPGIEIVRPEDGDRFIPPASIEIVAAAYHPTNNILRVDFYAGDAKIGESIVIFDRPFSGGLILHRFTWNNPPNGIHLLTARGFDENQTLVQTSKPVRITVGPESTRPVVKIEATKRIAEESSEPFRRLNFVGEFTVSRTGPTNNALSCFVQYSGMATPGADYQSLPRLVTIPSGSVSTPIRVGAINDHLPEGIETLEATLSHCEPGMDPATGIECINGFDIDPEHQSATVFLRDDGITEASLAITRPKDGAAFKASDAILIEAVALDLKGYISRVEFLDGEQRIGVSEIVFIRPPDPGTPIQHSFEWRSAASVPHVLTARTILADGTALQSQPVRITVGGLSPTDREFHAISIYSGITPNGGPSRNNERGEASVVVNRPGKKVTLFLSSYEPVWWHVASGDATIIEKVILGGYYRQEIDGIAAGVEIINAYYDEGQGTSNYLWPGTSLDSGRFFRVLQKLCGLVGMDLASFQGRYTAPYPTPLVIEQVENDPRLRCDYPQPVDLSQLPDIRFRLAFNDGASGRVAFQDYTLHGVAGASRLLPTWRVVTDAAGRYYYGADFHESWRVDTQTSALEDLPIPSNLPEFSWPVGITFDSLRNRILVATLVGEGYLYAYSPASGQWSLVRSLENEDLDSLVYHQSDDSLYGVTAAYYDGGAPSLLRLNANGEVTGKIPLPVQPYGVGVGGFRSELASVGEYLVLLLETAEWVADNGQPEARIYLIDPRSGQVWLTYRKLETPPNKPPAITILTPSNGAIYNPGADIVLGANVTDPDSDAGRARVEFYANGRKIGDAVGPNTSPVSWMFKWTNVTAGEYTLTATATDILGATATSSPVHVTVGSVSSLVRIEATSEIAEEDSTPLKRLPLAGEFSISRTGPSNGPLSIFVEYSGMATPGVDYPYLPWVITIPAGAVSTKIRVVPNNDQVPEGIETLVAKLSNCPPLTDPPLGMPCFAVEIDPSREQATVFIRDDGITTASLAITRPRDGATFAAGETILIDAIAIDLNGYIGSIEFWDAEQKIGESIIDFIRAPDPGTPINHSFAWRNASPGPHVLTARAILADGTVLKSASVRLAVGSADSLPTVDVVVRDAFAVEPRTNADLDTAIFGIRRVGPTNADLVVSYSLQGTAANGVDYEKLSGEAVIPAGQRFVSVTIRPLPDDLIELDESVILRLEDSPGEQPPRYYVGFQRRAVAIISDNTSANSSAGPQYLSLANGFPHVCFAAESGRTYRIEASTDLRRWQSVGVAISANGALHFVDPEAANIRCRFYRLAPGAIAFSSE